MQEQEYLMSETLSNIVRSNNRSAPTAALHVEVIADFACPFSYIGKRRLERALESVGGPVDIAWHPFQLNPDMPGSGMRFEDYLESRFGSRANIQPVLDNLASEGRELGIDFHFERIQRVPNTTAAHQLMHLASASGTNPSALAESLFSAFFEQGLDLGDEEVLVRIASEHGLDRDRVIATLADADVRQSVQDREAQVRGSGLQSVPGFLLNRRLLVVGAQSEETLLNAFDQAVFGDGNDTVVSPALH